MEIFMKTLHVKQFLSFVIIATFLGLFPLSKGMATNMAAPQIPIETASKKLKQHLQDESFIKDFNKVNIFVEKVVDPFIDFNRVSALVLGKLWKKATKDEKRRFKQEFHTLLVRTYSRAFFEFKDWSIRYLPLRLKENTKKTIVKTEILQPGIQPLALNYRMVLVKGQWKAYDIVIEGVSLVTNYRTTIKNEFRKGGSLDAVIKQLAKRNSAALSRNNS